MENKVISHIAKNKIIYSILIVMIAVGGIVTMDLSPKTDDGTLSGNLEDVVTDQTPVEEGVTEETTIIGEETLPPKEEMPSINEEETVLTLTTPPEGAKVVEGDILKVSWKNSTAGTGVSYNVFLTDPKNPNAGRVSIAEEVTKTEVDFQVPYDMVSEAESTKAFIVNVSVVGTPVTTAGPTISLAHAEDPASTVVKILSPALGETKEVTMGDEVTISWQGVQATETKMSVYLIHSSTNQTLLLAEAKIGASSLSTTLPSTLAAGDYKVILKTSQTTVEGGILSVYLKEEATQTPETGVKLEETKTPETVTLDPTPSKTEDTAQKPSVTENTTPKPTENTNTKPNVKEEPFANIPGAIEIND